MTKYAEFWVFRDGCCCWFLHETLQLFFCFFLFFCTQLFFTSVCQTMSFNSFWYRMPNKDFQKHVVCVSRTPTHTPFSPILFLALHHQRMSSWDVSLFSRGASGRSSDANSVLSIIMHSWWHPPTTTQPEAGIMSHARRFDVIRPAHTAVAVDSGFSGWPGQPIC